MKPLAAGIKGQLILALVAIILASNLAAFLGNVLVTKTTFDQWIGQNDRATARNLTQSLATYYSQNGSWLGVETICTSGATPAIGTESCGGTTTTTTTSPW